MSLRRVRSVLISGMELVMCSTCITNKYEPRYIIILAARTVGIEEAAKFIKERRYIGRHIPASDVL